MFDNKWGDYALIAVWFVAMVIALVVAVQHSHARDVGQWNVAQQGTDYNVELGQWLGRQRVPETRSSCCGEADAYWADEFVIVGDTAFAIITDTREDGPLQRPHIAAGTRIPIPFERVVDTRRDPNPGEHAWIFVRYDDEDDGWNVYCYIPNGGV